MAEDTAIAKAEQARDLRHQLGGLERDEVAGIIFRETSPKRQMTVIYSMRSGEPVEMPFYQAQKALGKWDPELGGYMFTSDKDKAPEYKLGTIKCFLHRESPEHPILEEIGLGGNHCRKETLSNQFSKRQHARHRHPAEWQAYQEHIEEQKEQDSEQRQKAQLEATLALAGRASENVVKRGPGRPRKTETCHQCGGVIEGKLADHQCSPS